VAPGVEDSRGYRHRRRRAKPSLERIQVVTTRVGDPHARAPERFELGDCVGDRVLVGESQVDGPGAEP
jgi:hypothetical protein